MDSGNLSESAKQPVQFKSQWTLVNEYRMHAKAAYRQEFAHRPPAVLVHGLGVSHRYWAPTAELLAKKYNVYMPDLPGFGQSEKPGRSLNIVELAEALCNWMQINELEQALLFGNSMGCQVIAELAAHYPERVVQMVLTGPSVDRRRRSMLGQMMRGLLDLPHEPLKLWWIITADYLIAGPVRTLETLRFAVGDAIEEKLPNIQSPTLVVRGEFDRFVPPEWAEEVARRLPHGRLVVIKDTAHGLIFSAAPELVRTVDEFIEAG